MDSKALAPSQGDPPPATVSDRRWVVLVVVAVAQMMTALDATIVNIALPSVQPALGFGDADRQWVITAYTRHLHPGDHGGHHRRHARHAAVTQRRPPVAETRLAMAAARSARPAVAGPAGSIR